MDSKLYKAALISSAVVVASLLLNAGCASIERKLLFYPTHHSNANGLTPWLRNNELIGYSRTVDHPKNIWLMIHGNGGQAADRAYAIHNFSDQDSIYILEYPGYGNRAGVPSTKSFNTAATEAFLELRNQYQTLPVCVIGESIGGGAGSYLATLPNPPNKIVLVVPFDELATVAKQHFPAFFVSMLLRDNWDNVQALSGYHGPVDIFGAQADEVIPVSHAKALAAAVPQSRFTLINGGHNDWSNGDQVKISNE